MAKKNESEKIKKPTNGANLSQNMDKRRDVPTGMNKRGGQGPK